MKPRLLIPATLLLTLTACQCLHEPPPGNSLVELINQRQFMLVARDYPEFLNNVASQIVKLDTELAWANYRKMEVIKANQKKTAHPVPPLLPPPPSQSQAKP